eukprot:Colp12_sorted_trinity150504_noHs@27860
MILAKLFFVFALVLCTVNALHFEIKEGEVKCFIEEVPEDTLIVGIYKTEVYDQVDAAFEPVEADTGIHVLVKDPEQDEVVDKDFAGSGRFTFTSQQPGEHEICLSTNTSRWFFEGRTMRVHLEIQVGENANDYSKIAKEEKLTELQLRIRQLRDQVTQIIKEQSFQRVREARFRMTSESTNQRVLWWACAQGAVLIGLGFWQMRHLKGFFEKKKLV